jgi:DNA-binding MarR family transcriptional regulator
MRLSKAHYESLAAIRYALRGFMNFSRDAARKAGLTAQQHQALLAIKGFPGRDFTSIAELAERLQRRHNGIVGLVDRLVHRQFVRRKPSTHDRRQVELHLTPKGDKVIERLSAIHLEELRQFEPTLRKLLRSIRETSATDNL